jgi:DNA-binding transcriptional regulator LsrR (DeoR family)
MTELQKRIVEVIKRHSVNLSISQAQIRSVLGVPNVGVYNSLSALRRQGIVDCWVESDRSTLFAARYWFLTRKGTELATALKNAPEKAAVSSPA